MAFVRKIKASLVRMDSSEYVGEDSYLFYDIDTACIRITDGTPGGRPACIEGAAGNVAWGSITGNLDDQQDLRDELDALVYTLPVADATTLGGIKSGGDISIDSNGIVTVINGGGNDTISTTVGVGATEVVYTIDTTTDIANKGLIVLEDTVTGEALSEEIHTFTGFSHNTFNIHSKMGDKLRHSIDVVFNGTDAEIKLTNNGTNEIQVRVTMFGAIQS